eukprot:TRINITY_DN37820_c0_g3_i3.p1 TRINITY_DN37820_c0_g3~~TRINITY_DN37820_c0_g3_i3.p1  ORF type:complete len:650 (+),score=152.12 TRINITY_DN37820_c0_g3_i3:54-2003(+)
MLTGVPLPRDAPPLLHGMTSLHNTNEHGPAFGWRPIAPIHPLPSSQALETERAKIRDLLQRHHDAIMAEFDSLVLGQIDEAMPPLPPDHVAADPQFMNGSALGKLQGESNGNEVVVNGEAQDNMVPLTLADDGLQEEPQTAKTVLDSVGDGTESGSPNANRSGTASKGMKSPMSAGGKQRSRTSFRTIDAGEEGGKGVVHRWVTSSKFELAFAALIALNTIMMCLEAQYNGFDSGYAIGHKSTEKTAAQTWPFAKLLFQIMEYFFGIAFTVEVICKVLAVHFRFFCSGWNIFDSVIILLWILTTMASMDIGMNPMFLRLARLGRLLRLLRFVKAFQVFDVLHLLIGSVKACASVFLWSVVVLLLIMVIVTLVLNYVVEAVVVDPGTDTEVAEVLFLYYGTFSRGMLSMFEVTLGNPSPICRAFHESVSEWFGILFMIYRLLINFALLKVINGIFMHETFRVAGSDDEIMILQKNRKTEMHIKKMTALFQEADESGDGLLEKQEFKDILADARVKTWLAAQELEIRDPDEVFTLVDPGRGVISAEDLVRGFSRLKGGAKSMDMVHLMRQMEQVVNRLDVLETSEGLNSTLTQRQVSAQSQAGQLEEEEEAQLLESSEQKESKLVESRWTSTKETKLVESSEAEEPAAKAE